MLGNVTKKPQVTAAVFYDCEFTKKEHSRPKCNVNILAP